MLDDAGAVVGKTEFSGSSVQLDGNTYSFDVGVSSPNLQGWYHGVLYAEDHTHPGEEEEARTSREHWQPPCYLEVADFTKHGQALTLDHSDVSLDLSAGVVQHGDEACQATTGTVTIQNGGVTTFEYKFKEGDMAAAVAGTFEFTVKVPADEVGSAKVVFADPNAAEDAV